MKKRSHERSRRPDAMKVLADARPAELDPSRLAGSLRHQEGLTRIMAETPDSRPGRVHVRPRTWVLPLGAVAAVAASAVVVSTLVQQEPVGTADEGASAHPPSATATQLDGRLELLAAAKKTEASATEGTYWQTTTRSQNVDVVGEPGQRYAVRTSETQQWSVGVRPGTQSLMVTGLDAETAPRTKADEARWRAAGSPDKVQIKAGADGSLRLSLPMGTDRRPLVMRTDANDEIYALGPHNVSYQDLLELPSGSGELRRRLERLYREDSGAETGAGRTAWMIRHAADLITMPVKPAVRAAAYRVIAELPGIRALGTTTDPVGRKGVGIAVPGTARTPLGKVEQQLIVDPTTGALLSEQVVLTEPSAAARDAGLEAGATMNYTATTRMGWAERQIDVPENARR